MKIYSWNIFYRNKNLESALRFIEGLDFDVLCLQEVPQGFLEHLNTLPFHIAVAVDVGRTIEEEAPRYFLVTLSKHPIKRRHEFSIPVPHIPSRTYLFIKMMRPFDWSIIENRAGMFVDIDTSEAGTVRIFNMHLTLAYPRSRTEELQIAMDQVLPGMPTVICGDFNILERARVAILNWILGGSFADAFLWPRERIQMERFFHDNGFKNPLRNMQTHAISGSQLDHILVSDSAQVGKKAVLQDPLGSDHKPVCIDVFF